MNKLKLICTALWLAAATASAQQTGPVTEACHAATALMQPAEGYVFRPVPPASDAFWRDSVPEALRRSYITCGGEYAGQPWISLPATVFAQFKSTGNRTAYEALMFGKRRRLAALVMAEVAEGQGRFMNDIIDGLQSTLEETWWGLPAHYGKNIPVADDQNVDLFNAETAALVAWTSYVLADRIDAFSPLLRKRIDSEISRRILRPALQKKWWWKTAGMNWNPWISSNWLACVLFCEHDAQRRKEAITQIAAALDAFISAYPADGGCDEGPGYWDRAAASLADCLMLLREASAGAVDLSRNAKIAAMGSYIYKMYIGNGYCVNFADAHDNRMVQQLNAVYPFGRYLHDRTMTRFAAYTAQQQQFADSAAAIYLRSGNWPVLGRELMMLRHVGSMLDETPEEPAAADMWLPDLQIMTARRGSMFVAMKGGHNDESHNHNDVGSFIVYAGGEPLLIDPGVGEYTAQTFGKGRYDIWTMQSEYHNLPLINGVAQANGRSYAARAVKHADGRLTMDIAAAYTDSAAVRTWTRTVKATRSAVEITEDYALDSLKAPSRLMLMTTIRPETSVPGIVTLGKRRIIYPAGRIDVTTEDVSALMDPLLQGMWGNTLYRIVMTLRSPETTSRVTYKIE